MRKLLLNIFFLLIGVIISQAQSAFEHALILRKYVIPVESGNTSFMFDTGLEDGLLDVCSPILSLYPHNNLSEPEEDLLDAYYGNPFLGDMQRQAKVLFPDDFQSSPNFRSSSIVDVPAAVPKGLPVTNLADGLAKFLVKRTKEELSMAFFQRFKDAVKSKPNLQELFPQTASILLLIDEDIYQYNAYLEALREHFIKDMKGLAINLEEALRDGDLLKGKIKYQLIAKDVLHVADLLIEGESPLDLMNYLAEEAYLLIDPKLKELPEDQQKIFQDVGAGFKVVELLSNSLRSKEDGKIWIDSKAVVEVFKDPTTFYIYLGLLWQDAEGITFSNGESLRDVLGKMANSVNKLEDMKQQIVEFVEYGGDLKNDLAALKGKIKEGNAVYNDYYSVFYEVFELLETGIDFKKTFLPQLLAQGQLDDQILELIKLLNELNFNIRQKHYAAGVTNLVSVLKELLGDDFTFQKDVLKYGNFIAIVAEAENSDQVAAAIEAVALPPGSSIIKKRSKFSVALNGYTGLGGGIEFLEARPDDNKWITGVSAPLGFSFNVGLEEKGSVGMYVPLIDIGAITAFRFGDATTKDLPELNLQNILAPGAYAIYSWGNDIPVMIGLGAQLGPNLRDVTVGQNTIESSGWRFGLLLSVDIPIFNLFVR